MNDHDFNNYSFYEMGKYDLAATVDHILEVTGK